MPYNILRSDGITPHTILDNEIDNTYSRPLLGREKINYGETVAQGILHALENYANTTPPRGAVKGQLWFDTSVDALRYYDGADPLSDTDTVSTDPALWKSVSGIVGDGVDSHLIPKIPLSLDLGSTTSRWHNVYANHGNFSEHVADATFALTVSGTTLLKTGSKIFPETDATGSIGMDLGQSANRWRTLFARNAKLSGDLTISTATGVTGAILRSDSGNNDTVLGIGQTGPTARVNLGNTTTRFNLFANDITATKMVLAPGGVNSSLTPNINEFYDIGAFPGQQFNNVYAKEIFEDGVSLLAKYGAQAIALNAISDVTLTAPANGDIVVYNSTTLDWENQNVNSGVIDHGGLSGLGDDDHPQYLNELRADGLYLTVIDPVAEDSFRLNAASNAAVKLFNTTSNNGTFLQAFSDGDFYISQLDSGANFEKHWARFYDNAGVALNYNGTERLLTHNGGLVINSASGADTDVRLINSLGSGRILMQSSTGNFFLQQMSANGAAVEDIWLHGTRNGAVRLYNNGSEKLRTEAGGVVITGTGASSTLTTAGSPSNTLTTKSYVDTAGVDVNSSPAQFVNNVTTWAHGLGAEPDHVSVWIQCVSANATYAVGDRLLLSSSMYSRQTEADLDETVGFMIKTTASQIDVYTAKIFVPIKGVGGQGVHQQINNGSWRYYFKAVKF